MTSSWQRVFVRKELRALGPSWLAFAGVVLLGALLVPGGAFLGYVIGAFLLAAMSIGHEYTNRTLQALLAQPVDRRQVFVLKLTVVVGLVALLAALALAVDLSNLDRLWKTRVWYVSRRDAELIRSLNVGAATMLLVPGLAAVCLAPWFTMLSRGPLGGFVFAMATLGLCWVGGEIGGTLRFGLAHESLTKVHAFRTEFVWWAMAFLSAAGAALTWRSFAALEANAGPGTPVALERRNIHHAKSGRSESVRRPWWWQVAHKELHLHKMIFVIAALYVVFWCAIHWSSRYLPALAAALGPVSYLYAGAVALLLGSFASAEERQLGTLDWQVLMPVPARKQWGIKVLVVCVLCVMLGFALPWALDSIASLPNDVPGVRQDAAEFLFALLGLAVGSLYVSSAATGGLRALVASLAAALPISASIVGLLWLSDAISDSAMPLLREWGWYRSGVFGVMQGVLHLRLGDQLAIIATAALAIALLSLGLANHKSADRNSKRIRRQLGWVSVSAVMGSVLIGSVQAATLDDWRVTGASGFRARGHVRLEGTGTLDPNERFHVFIDLVPEDGTSRGGGWGSLRRDLTFSTTYGRPGPGFLRVEVWGENPWAVKSVVHHGRDITDANFDLAADLDDVVITLSDQLGQIKVQVDKIDRALVCLFPADRALWQDDAAMRRRFSCEMLTATVHKNGAFAFDMPPDGEYLLVAFDKLVSSESTVALGGRERRLAALERIAPLADRIQARQGTTMEVSLKVRR